MRCRRLRDCTTQTTQSAGVARRPTTSFPSKLSQLPKAQLPRATVQAKRPSSISMLRFGQVFSDDVASTRYLPPKSMGDDVLSNEVKPFHESHGCRGPNPPQINGSSLAVLHSQREAEGPTSWYGNQKGERYLLVARPVANEKIAQGHRPYQKAQGKVYIAFYPGVVLHYVLTTTRSWLIWRIGPFVQVISALILHQCFRVANFGLK